MEQKPLQTESVNLLTNTGYGKITINVDKWFYWLG